MATDGYVNRWDDVDYSAAEERRLASALLMPGATPFSARTGRRPGGGGLVTSIVGSPSAAQPVLRTTGGPGVIFDPNYAAAGPYPFEVPSVTDITSGARPSTGQSRIDLIVARLYDTGPGVTVGTESKLMIEKVPGNPNSAPSAPGLPPLSMLISTVTVPSSGEITVVNSTQRTVAAGGILPVDTTNEMNALKTAGIAYPGLTVYNLQTKSLFTYDGAEFQGDTDWVAPSLGTWSNFDAPRATAGYRRKNGVVYLKGMVKSGSVSTIFNLLPGFRPAATDRWDVPASAGTASIEIGAAGDVVVAAYKAGGDNSAVSLAPIRFIAEA